MSGTVVQRAVTIGMVFAFSGLTKGCAMPAEGVKYRVVMQSSPFELRDYPAQVVAETVVDGTMSDAGNKAFGRLFGYISGKNRSREKISMTAPVSQEPASVKIAMTAPVGQERVDGGWIVTFAMPEPYTMESLPIPDDPAVRLRQLAARRMAVVGYSGSWSERRYLQHRQELETWIETNGFLVLGEPVWARYNPPFTLWFLRRNEILVPVAGEKRAEESGAEPAGGDGGGK